MKTLKKEQEMSRGPKNLFELIFTFLLMGLAILIMALSIKIGFGRLREAGPGFFPFLTGMLLLISSIVHIVSKEIKDNKIEISAREIKIYLSLIIVFMIWIFAMPIFGHAIITFIATFLLSKIMKLEGWLKPISLSVGTTVFLYAIFDRWLDLDLPRGLLG